MGLTNNSTGSNILSFNPKNYENADYEISLAGNPNVGKSTLFNELTGMNQHTGNWPGKTVDNAIGYYEYKNKKIRVIDLPGTYSLLSNSEEEEVARNYLCFGDSDLVVVMADATALERNLNLFFQIQEITENVVLCVNLIDEANKKGIQIDLNKLEDEINAPVVFISAREKIGIELLKSKIEKQAQNGIVQASNTVDYGSNIENAIEKAQNILTSNGLNKINSHKLRWIAIRLLEGNESIISSIKEAFSIDESTIEKIKMLSTQELSDIDIKDILIKSIINKSEDIYINILVNQGKSLKFQNVMDKIAVSKATGIPLMIITLLIILWITISLANYPSELLTIFFAKVQQILVAAFAYFEVPWWLSGILIDGMYVTLAWVVSVMLPPMAIFFPLFTLLEDFGYLPRIAFNLDKCFKKCSSCGKQALTMCMGLGCNAAGVVGCRIINSPREKLIAIVTNAFMPCNGRFPTLISIAIIFIGGEIAYGKTVQGFVAALVVTFIILIGVIMTFIVSKILSKTMLKGVPTNCILELPPYRKPNLGKVIVRSIYDRTIYVLGRAIAVAAPAGIIIWLFANIFIGDRSVLTICADFLQPFAYSIGLDGYILMAFILGLPANEIIIPIIIMSYLKLGSMVEMDNLSELRGLLINNGWNLLTAVNLMILCLMHFPCATTLITIKEETKSLKWTFISFLIPTVMGIVVCFLVTSIWRFVS